MSLGRLVSTVVRVKDSVIVMVSVMVIVIVSLTGCEYKELCYDHNHWVTVRVAFDWSACPDAEPQGMTVLFYNEQALGSEPVRYDLPGREGGIVRLQPGKWRAMAYNYDTETILYRGMDMPATLEAYTRLSSIEEGTLMSTRNNPMPRATNTEQEPVILEPDPLWGGSGETFTLTMSGPEDYGTMAASRASEQTRSGESITLKPYHRVCYVTVTIRDVPNLQYTGQLGAALSGLAPSVWMESGRLGEGAATQAFTCYTTDATTLQARFRIFGHCPRSGESEINPHMLTIYAILADGTKWYYTYDVTGQMHDLVKNPDNYNITIDLKDLPLPKPIVNGSGFRPTVDGWMGEEIEVTM